MRWKIVAAFGAGALLASGIVYMAVKPDAPAKRTLVSVVGPPPVVQPVAPAPPAPGETPSAPVTKPADRVRVVVREKPSPMPPPVRREKPAEVAQSQAPPPMPEPINKERPENDAKREEPVPAPVAEPQPAPPQPPPAPPEEAPKPAPEPQGPAPHTVTIAIGTILPVRIGETISSAHSQLGDSFLATLDQQLVIDGFIIAERGARVEGRIVEAEQAGRGDRSARLGVQLVRLSTSDGQRIRIHTEAFKKEAGSSTGGDLAKVGAGAAIGAAIGAIAGGGKGAAIGAGAGAAAGAGTILLTHGKAAEIPVETRLSFKISEPVTITERLN